MSFSRRFPLSWILGLMLCTGIGSAALAAPRDPAEVISRARANLGSESTLRAVETIRMECEIENFRDKSKGPLRSFLKKPMSQRTEYMTDKMTVITGLDSWEGWEQVVPTDPNFVGRKSVHPVELARRMRYNVVENLHFFEGYKIVGGSIEAREPTTFEGRKVDVVAYTYDSENTYLRLFDQKSGAFVATQYRDGLVSKETGSQLVGAIRFPETIELWQEGELLSRVTIQKIEINVPLDDGLFAFP